MYSVMFLVMRNLGSAGTSWIRPGKWVNIKDLQASPAHKGRGQSIVQSHSLKRKKIYGKISVIEEKFVSIVVSGTARRFVLCLCIGRASEGYKRLGASIQTTPATFGKITTTRWRLHLNGDLQENFWGGKSIYVDRMPDEPGRNEWRKSGRAV